MNDMLVENDRGQKGHNHPADVNSVAMHRSRSRLLCSYGQHSSEWIPEPSSCCHAIASVESKRERGLTYEYYFVDPGNTQYDIRVCQKMFLFQFPRQWWPLLKRTDEGTVKEDMRGDTGNTEDKSRKQIVINHIMSFRCLISHYVRKTRKEQFLPSEVILKRMHRMHIKYCQDNNYKIESYDF